MKKNKIINIIVGVALCISLCGNVYLFQCLSSNNEAIAAMSNQVIVADDQILDLQQQLSDFNNLQKQVEDLQAQLTASNEQISTLETSLSESNSQIASLEQEIAENEVTIASLQSQQSTVEAQQPQTPVQTQQPVTNNIPGPVFGEGAVMGTGDGSGAIGSFGHYE